MAQFVSVRVRMFVHVAFACLYVCVRARMCSNTSVIHSPLSVSVCLRTCIRVFSAISVCAGVGVF